MLDSAELKITIDIADIERTSRTTATSTGTSETSAKPSAPAQDSGGSQAAKALGKIVSVKNAAHIADRLVSYEINTVNMRTGAKEYEQKLQFGYSIAKKTISAGAMIAGGVATGTLPIVLAGMALSAVNKGIEIAQNYRTLQIQDAREEITIQFLRQRTGALDRRYRGED